MRIESGVIKGAGISERQFGKFLREVTLVDPLQELIRFVPYGNKGEYLVQLSDGFIRHAQLEIDVCKLVEADKVLLFKLPLLLDDQIHKRPLLHIRPPVKAQGKFVTIECAQKVSTSYIDLYKGEKNTRKVLTFYFAKGDIQVGFGKQGLLKRR